MGIKNILISLIVPLVLLLIMFLFGLHLKNQVRNTKCYYCKRKIGKYYDKEDGSRYRTMKEEDLWCHTKCIPKDKLRTWRRTH